MPRLSQHVVRNSVRTALEIVKETDFTILPMTPAQHDRMMVAAFEGALVALLKSGK